MPSCFIGRGSQFCAEVFLLHLPSPLPFPPTLTGQWGPQTAAAAPTPLSVAKSPFLPTTTTTKTKRRSLERRRRRKRNREIGRPRRRRRRTQKDFLLPAENDFIVVASTEEERESLIKERTTKNSPLLSHPCSVGFGSSQGRDKKYEGQALN